MFRETPKAIAFYFLLVGLYTSVIGLGLYFAETKSIWTAILGTYNLVMGAILLIMGIRFSALLKKRPALMVDALALMIMLRLLVEVFFFIDLTDVMFYLRIGVFLIVYSYLIRSVKRLAKAQYLEAKKQQT